MDSLNDVKGRIFDIQRFSVHDGPGIRTIVFLKGCLLRCRWCCNPESQEWDIQQMNTKNGIKTVGEDTTVGKVMEEVVKDVPFYLRSGGGLTLSGGEAMCQSDFAIALCKAAHEYGINTAIETTAALPQDVVARVIPHIDYVMLDIKHMNSDKHKEFTGRANELILENAKYIDAHAKKLIIRIPVIPTFNDTPQEILDIAKFANSLPHVTDLHLLPYHRLGQDKYAGLNREYLMGDIPTIPNEKMQYLLEVAQQSGLNCRIGG
ncbi:MAG: glycyl-radical enzyme activating protein [Ruminococcaceae bacterium]|nr:glycyl-radical enzyme activating protein [Oscillospiraceae bacterium]